MYLQLIRNNPQGAAISGRLVINGRWFCNTLERKGVEIPALCYHVCVTQSPRFKRLLPIVQNVPQRSGIRIHRGSKPEHSSGCVLVVADNKDTVIQQPKQLNPTTLQSTPKINRFFGDPAANQLPGALKGIGRSAADVERELTSLILKAQQEHEEIILEVTDFSAGTEYGYNTPCERELQQHEIDARRAEQRYYELHPEECKC
ncbi:MAG: hypothetical protein IIU96_00445 [Paludibacteraceae bacterium]|nr:hypothetical protein [Paludibacteraceae bacterium]